jgi:hypothetical protein
MGGIIFWGIIRTAILIPALWILQGMMEYKYWWWFSIFAVYGVILHPAMIQYNMFVEKTNNYELDFVCIVQTILINRQFLCTNSITNQRYGTFRRRLGLGVKRIKILNIRIT